MPFINVNQCKIFYYDNKLEGIPLLFIHGWLGSSLEWVYQLFHFNLKKHIIMLDLPGFGKSDKLKTDYSIEFFTKYILKFLKLLGYNEIIPIGHSLGGLIAQNITIKNPNLVKKLILISTSVGFCPSTKDKLAFFWLNLFFKLFYRNILKNIIKRILSVETENRKFRKLYTDVLKLPKVSVLSTFKNMNSKLNLKKELSTISQPTLILYGTEDKIISKSMVGEIKDLIPNSELKIIENGSHRMMYDNYAKVNQFIEEFIKSS
ncbi:MAG: alpha/beta fold hydrolase [Candidatus Hodarchaeota archaeon]